LTRTWWITYAAGSVAVTFAAGAVAGLTPMATLHALVQNVIGLAFAIRGIVT
jgi:uncharacterized protein (DUF2062 family)